MTNDENKKKTHPVKTWKNGPIQLAVWENPGQEDRTFLTMSFDRSYKDQSGEFKSTKTLRASDLPRLRVLLDLAYEYATMEHYAKSDSEE